VKIQGPAIQTYNKCVSGGSHPLYIHKPVCTVLRSKKEEGEGRESACALHITLSHSPLSFSLRLITNSYGFV